MTRIKFTIVEFYSYFVIMILPFIYVLSSMIFHFMGWNALWLLLSIIPVTVLKWYIMYRVSNKNSKK